jgi:hypothetical protein
MKLPTLICSFLLVQFSIGQYNPDTTIPKSALYDLKIKINQLEEANKFNGFKLRLLLELKRIDTIHKSKDSIVLFYYTDRNLLLQKQKQIYRPGCMTDSIVWYYNRKGLVEYIGYWTWSCRNVEKVNPNEKYLGYKSSYDRFEYDTFDRIKKHVYHKSTPMTYRSVINYDSHGKTSIKTTQISESEFWE